MPTDQAAYSVVDYRFTQTLMLIAAVPAVLGITKILLVYFS